MEGDGRELRRTGRVTGKGDGDLWGPPHHYLMEPLKG